MREINIFAGVAALLLIGVGTWIGVETWGSASTRADSTVNPPEVMMTSGAAVFRSVDLHTVRKEREGK